MGESKNRVQPQELGLTAPAVGAGLGPCRNCCILPVAGPLAAMRWPVWWRWHVWVPGLWGWLAVPPQGRPIPGEKTPPVLFLPSDTSRLAQNAHYYKLMGQPELGLKELELAHQQNPDNLQIADLLAQNYEELGKFEAARQVYQDTFTRRASHPIMANNFCFTYYTEGRWQEAETCFRKTLARDPGNVAARNNLGLLYCRLGRQAEARRLWQETEGAAAADAKLGEALAALGMSDRAVYAQKSESAPPAARVTQAPTPKAAVAHLPAPVPAKVHAPVQPVAPKETAKPVATKPSAPTPVAVNTSPEQKPRKQAASSPAGCSGWDAGNCHQDGRGNPSPNAESGRCPFACPCSSPGSRLGSTGRP